MTLDEIQKLLDTHDNAIALISDDIIRKLLAVAKAAQLFLDWHALPCPSCSIDNPSPDVPCYCADHMRTAKDLKNALKLFEDKGEM